MATTLPTGDGGGVDTSGLLKDLLEKRHVQPSSLIDTFNPLRLSSYGHGTANYGADPAAKGPFYVFITKPDLNLTSEEAIRRYSIGTPMAPKGIADLLSSGSTGFIKLMSNQCEGYSLSDFVLDILSTGENWEGARVALPKSMLNSRQDSAITLEFNELAGLPLTIATILWTSYIDDVGKGYLVPKLEGAINYINKRYLDYAVSIFGIQTQPDGRTIESGFKMTGCFPTAIPISAHSAQRGPSEAIKIQVPFHANYIEFMDRDLFEDFAVISAGTGVSIDLATLPDSKRQVYQINFSEGILEKDGL